MSATITPLRFDDRPRPAHWQFGQESVDARGGWQVVWQLKRNCSMAPGQMLFFFAALCLISLSIATFFWHQGARMVMTFAWIELLAVGSAMLLYARHAADREMIALHRDTLTVEHACGNRVERVEFQRAWVCVEPRSGDRSLIELSGQGRRIAVGRFIRPELRRHLADELRLALRRSPPAAACPA